MPTYTVTAPCGDLDASQKVHIAQEITRIHSEATGAPTYFAQVIFDEVDDGNYFIGGEPLSHQQVFVHGEIRGGRTLEEKGVLISSMIGAVAGAASVPRTSVWVYIIDIPARQMVEFGHVLPEPGDEAAWTAALPASDREMMRAIGSRGRLK